MVVYKLKKIQIAQILQTKLGREYYDVKPDILERFALSKDVYLGLYAREKVVHFYGELYFN